MDASLRNNVRYKQHRQKKAAALRALEEELISAGGEGVLLTKERSAVLALRPMDLLQRLRDGTLAAVTVLQAYQAKAMEVTQRCNCVTEFIPDAKKFAEALDLRKSKHKSSEELPLFGLPVSVKDIIMVEGMDCTFGLSKNVDRPSSIDADIIKIVRDLGAVPYVKTNTPQLCLTPGCSNPVWGETLHPLNPERSPGGSSGGEAALISDGGSMVGFGTDIAGSIRLPASWCGIYGIKPTALRMPRRGVVGLIRPVGIYSTAGVMGCDAALVAEVTRAIFSVDLHKMDVDLPPVPWNDEAYLSKKPLRVGYFDSHDLLPSTPGVKRAVGEAVSAFKSLGHEVFSFSIENLADGVNIYTHLLFADNGVFTSLMLEGETVDEGLEWFNEFAALLASDVQQKKAELREKFGDIAVDLYSGRLASIPDLWKKMGERSSFCSSFLEAWKKDDMDILVCPVFPSPPPKTHQISKLSPSFPLTFLFNLLDYPAAAVPVTRQVVADERNIADYQTTDLLHEYMKENGTNAVGLPLGVQLVALPYCEELLCRAVREISDVVDYRLQC